MIVTENNADVMMKKIKFMFLCALMAFLSGCGNGYEMLKKELKSDFGTLNRHVRVYDSRTRETIWNYTGEVYVSDGSTPGNITVIYRDSRGKARKNDFIGENLSLIMLEAYNGDGIQQLDSEDDE